MIKVFISTINSSQCIGGLFYNHSIDIVSFYSLSICSTFDIPAGAKLTTSMDGHYTLVHGPESAALSVTEM